MSGGSLSSLFLVTSSTIRLRNLGMVCDREGKRGKGRERRGQEEGGEEKEGEK